MGGLLSLSTYVYHSRLQSSLDNNYIQIQLCNFHVRSPVEANKFRNKLLPNQLHRHRNLAIDTHHAYMHFLKQWKELVSKVPLCIVWFFLQTRNVTNGFGAWILKILLIIFWLSPSRLANNISIVITNVFSCMLEYNLIVYINEN